MMKHILVTALLTASTTTFSETYICQREGKTGLMTFERETDFGTVNYGKIENHVFVFKEINEEKYELRHSDGGLISECTISHIKLDDAILCHSKTGFFQLEIGLGKYVETDIGVKYQSNKANDLIKFDIEGGKCDLFEK